MNGGESAGGQGTGPGAGRGAGDGGFTFIEVLFAVVLMTTSFAAILGGLRMAVLGSDMHGKQALAQPVLTSAAEHLKAAPHVACASPEAYLPAVRLATPEGWSSAQIAITAPVRYGNGTDFTADCYDKPEFENRLHLQLVTITVTTPDGRATESVEVVKGQP